MTKVNKYPSQLKPKITIALDDEREVRELKTHAAKRGLSLARYLKKTSDFFEIKMSSEENSTAKRRITTVEF